MARRWRQGSAARRGRSGATYRAGEAVGFEREGARISAVVLADGERLPCAAVVNAAGPNARAVAALAGVALPVEARRRSVFVLACRERLPGCPLVIDTTGVWFRPEGDRFLAGWSPPDEEDPERWALEVDHEQWEGVVWPALAARVPAFEAVRVTGAWAGHYDYNTFDHNALLGALPEVPNLYFANGFSGHGMQQAAGAGRGISELILHGRYRTLDLSDLDVGRVAAGRPTARAEHHLRTLGPAETEEALPFPRADRGAAGRVRVGGRGAGAPPPCASRRRHPAADARLGWGRDGGQAGHRASRQSRARVGGGACHLPALGP